MARQRRPYYNPYARTPRSSVSEVQLPGYHPVDLGIIQQSLAGRQQRYDIANTAQAQAFAKLQEAETADIIDRQRKEELMNSLKDKYSQIVGDYKGDIGAASGDITGFISQMREDPFWQANKYRVEQANQADKIRAQLQAKGETPITLYQGQSAYDPTMQTVRDRQAMVPVIAGQRNYMETARTLMSQLKENVTDELGVENVDGALSVLANRRISEISDPRLKSRVKKAVDAFKVTEGQYLQKLAADNGITKPGGLTPAEAEKALIDKGVFTNQDDLDSHIANFMYSANADRPYIEKTVSAQPLSDDDSGSGSGDDNINNAFKVIENEGTPIDVMDSKYNTYDKVTGRLRDLTKKANDLNEPLSYKEQQEIEYLSAIVPKIEQLKNEYDNTEQGAMYKNAVDKASKEWAKQAVKTGLQKENKGELTEEAKKQLGTLKKFVEEDVDLPLLKIFDFSEGPGKSKLTRTGKELFGGISKLVKSSFNLESEVFYKAQKRYKEGLDNFLEQDKDYLQRTRVTTLEIPGGAKSSVKKDIGSDFDNLLDLDNPPKDSAIIYTDKDGDEQIITPGMEEYESIKNSIRSGINDWVETDNIRLKRNFIDPGTIEVPFRGTFDSDGNYVEDDTKRGKFKIKYNPMDPQFNSVRKLGNKLIRLNHATPSFKFSAAGVKGGYEQVNNVYEDAVYDVIKERVGENNIAEGNTNQKEEFKTAASYLGASKEDLENIDNYDKIGLYYDGNTFGVKVADKESKTLKDIVVKDVLDSYNSDYLLSSKGLRPLTLLTYSIKNNDDISTQDANIIIDEIGNRLNEEKDINSIINKYNLDNIPIRHPSKRAVVSEFLLQNSDAEKKQEREVML